MNPKSTLHTVLVVSFAFGLYYFIDECFFHAWYHSLSELTGLATLSFGIAYVLVGLPITLSAIWLHRRNWLKGLGLIQNLPKAVVAAFLFTLPMLAGYATIFPFNLDVSLQEILTDAVFAAFFEELYFRGAAFGLIFRYSKVGFIPAILIGSLLFALVHLHQSQDPTVLAGIFLTTFLGGILFAWTYIEWDANLWVPIFLHLLMNLFWMLFSAGDNALGGPYANAFRGIAIAATIIGTIVWKRKKGVPLAVNRGTAFWKIPTREERCSQTAC